MSSLKYFYINDQKFNYELEFQNNHKDTQWKHNAPLIEYCETLGITIPHYCYHKSLSISGNCRMCLVELKNSPKPMVSCAMSAKSCLNNSEIFTESPLVKKARENILEFLLLNHPLDCPICDQGGECDLQDQSLYFGNSKKRFYNFKRIVTDKNIGPIIKTVMTRCIHCTRCVRFSAEIAGTEDLGMFGRGLDSEIGTYVSKTFQSELSGNVIDLCPVGALTIKPYPFLSRSWELKNTNAVDFSDGFGTNLEVSLKNNQIVKIIPGYDNSFNSNIWISDKTRFSFNGMFSPSRILTGLIEFKSAKSVVPHSWQFLLKEIVLTLYFQDHLSNHFLKINNLIIVFGNEISIEVLNLLNLFSKKYNFIKLKQFTGKSSDNDLESNFLSQSPQSYSENLKKSTLCFLIGTYSRYESVNLNLKLRNRYLKGNFKIITLGSTKDFTFPTINLGLNIKTLQSIIEGTNNICRGLISSKNPIIHINSYHSNRSDYKEILKLLTSLKKQFTKYHLNWNNLNILNNSMGDVGINYLYNFKEITINDLMKSNGLYFLNIQPNSFNFQKIIKLKLLNYYLGIVGWPRYLFNQTIGLPFQEFEEIKNSCVIFNSLHLPNSALFESTGTFFNTEGVIKNTIKFISPKKQTKDDWQIIRKIFSNSNNINFLETKKDNEKIFFNSIKFKQFKKFIEYLNIATPFINNKHFNLGSNIKKVSINLCKNFKSPQSKLYLTKIKIWLNDFYVGGLDSYSRHSDTMIECSKIIRQEKNTFSHI